MDTDDLHMAVVIGREGSLTAASARLGVAPGTLSKAVARLERATKVKLFERLPRGMKPTELGAVFLKWAQRIDIDAHDLHAELRDLRQSRSGVLRLGIGHGIPDHWLKPVATDFIDRGVSIDLCGGVTDSLMRGVALGEIEFAVIGLHQAPGEGLAWEAILADPMQPIAPLAHPLAASGRTVSWQELAEARWVVNSPGTSTYSEFQENFTRRGIRPPQVAVASRSSKRERMLAIALDALMLAPRSSLNEPEQRSRFAVVAPIGGWHSPRRVGIVHRAGGYLSPSATRAIELLKEVMQASH